jgi:hypothetical protein
MMIRLALLAFCGVAFAQPASNFLNGGKPLLDAHNCYPEDGQWADRIDRALSLGVRVGIEQDLAWYVDPATHQGRIVLSHTSKPSGSEPTLEHYFFERVRPVMEEALRTNNREAWPLVVLHFDFKSNEAPLLRAVWDLLGYYEPWITTATRVANETTLEPFDPRPLLVLTEDSDAQEQVFFREVRIGAKLRVFGSAHTNRIPGDSDRERAHNAAAMSPEELLSEHPTNYRRWWNNSWYEVEEGGQPNAGDWTETDQTRLRSLVDHAHRLGFWIRFYTLDGFTNGLGWNSGYNFGSLEAAAKRWNAAREAGVDLIATDQYEDLARVMRNSVSGFPPK